MHVFEPRYRQLLTDLQKDENMVFGILFDHPLNKDHLGSIVRLESVLKEYDTGESDIVVQCLSNFVLDKYYSRHDDKLYPAGEVFTLLNSQTPKVEGKLKSKFNEYIKLRDGKSAENALEFHDIANMLHLEVHDKIKYIKTSSDDKRSNFLFNQIKYNTFILEQENKAKSKFYLN